MSKYNEFIYLQSLYGVYAEAEELVSNVNYETNLIGEISTESDILGELSTDVALTGSLD